MQASRRGIIRTENPMLVNSSITVYDPHLGNVRLIATRG